MNEKKHKCTKFLNFCIDINTNGKKMREYLSSLQEACGLHLIVVYGIYYKFVAQFQEILLLSSKHEISATSDK